MPRTACSGREALCFDTHVTSRPCGSIGERSFAFQVGEHSLEFLAVRSVFVDAAPSTVRFLGLYFRKPDSAAMAAARRRRQRAYKGEVCSIERGLGTVQLSLSPRKAHGTLAVLVLTQEEFVFVFCVWCRPRWAAVAEEQTSVVKGSFIQDAQRFRCQIERIPPDGTE